MRQDVSELRQFYESPLGMIAARLIRRQVRAFWPDLAGCRVLALGYGTPLLKPMLDEAERVIAVMPDRQGVVRWPPGEPGRVALGEETALPLPDNAFDRILLVHAVETSERVRPLLREVWRVVTDGGRVIVIVPNRRGVWARLEWTPFGHGHPYSQSQLAFLLRDNMFVPVRTGFALYMPPSRRRFVRRLALAWERFGARWTPPFGGLALCEAEKQVYGAIPLTQARRTAAPARLRGAGASLRHRSSQETVNASLRMFDTPISLPLSMAQYLTLPFC